jgi:diguanylate cyclase (GGDEF)-like protein
MRRGRFLPIACAAAWFAATAAASAASDQLAPSSSSAIAPRPALVDPMTLAVSASLMVIGLLLLLYFYRRRTFILCWISAWGLGAASAFLINQQYPSDKLGYLAYGTAQYLGILSALGFLLSAEAYRDRPKIGRRNVLALLGLLIWFTLAPLALGLNAVFAPGHLAMAGALFAAGVAHIALLRRSRLVGAAIVGTMLMLVAASHIWVALTVPQPSAPAVADAVFVNVGLYMLLAVGMQLMTFEDMTYELRATNHRLRAAQDRLKQMVTTDSLTGCRNRRFFNEIIDQELQRHRRYKAPLTLMFVDVDKFKTINDTLGHDVGDRVLQRVAAFLIGKVRGADSVFRWGGDEFLILLSCREAEAQRKGIELQTTFARFADDESLPQGAGLSIGCVEVPPDAREIMELVNAADERMYANKRKLKLARA